MTGDAWDQLAERARQTAAARPAPILPPARLSDSTEYRYRVHVTERAASLGIPERLLLEVIEGGQPWAG